MKCLDTAFLIDFLHDDKGAVKKASALKDDELMTTSINVFEVCVGIFRKKEGADSQFEQFRGVIGALEICPVDTDSSVLAGMISGNLILQGKSVEVTDCLIAGAMLSKKCNTIITRDKEHFSRMKGIKVETY